MENTNKYQIPQVGLLNEKVSNSVETTFDYTESIVNTFKSFDVIVEKIKSTVGPTISLYEIVPTSGTKVSKIKNLEKDLALGLGTNCRIIAPMPGRGTIGIEIANTNPQIVPMSEMLSSDEFSNTTMELPLILGKTIEGTNHIIDLAKMPHLLVAGATGQGKSVGINAMLTSLLFKKDPNDLRLVLIDPKRVELSSYNEAKPFLMREAITNPTEAISVLKSLCFEMDDRYNLLQHAGARNITEYNKKVSTLNPDHGHKHLPYIVVVIDEFADLMMTAGKEVETCVMRLAQLARAIGIHLIVATQRPSVDVITGIIKANLPARIAFKTTSATDSKTIGIDGADQLIGKGDMLFSNGTETVRIQCPFISTEETESVVKFIGSQDVQVDEHYLINLD